MTTEHSSSQNQQPEKTTYTSDKRYQNSLANYVHDSQQAFGLEKYGIPLSEVPLDRYDWQLMAIEESVDMNQYLTQEVRRLKEQRDHWRRYANAQTGRITMLNSQVEGLEEEQTKLLDENEDLRKQLAESNQWLVDLINEDSVQQAKEMMEHGTSD